MNMEMPLWNSLDDQEPGRWVPADFLPGLPRNLLMEAG